MRPISLRFFGNSISASRLTVVVKSGFFVGNFPIVLHDPNRISRITRISLQDVAQMIRVLDLKSVSARFTPIVFHCKLITVNSEQHLSRTYITLWRTVFQAHYCLGRAQTSSYQRRNMSVFKFSDYDCVGFDLDNTLLRYNITNVVILEYNALAEFLVSKKNYSPKYLKRPLLDEDLDFMQKGVLLDFDNGNIVRVSGDGLVRRASHGTRLLTDAEIEEYYPNRHWKVGDIFYKDFLATWNGPLSLKIRAVLDYFDMPTGLIFARMVDTLDDENEGKLDSYHIWPDVLAGMVDMFERDQFPKNQGGFFPHLRKNPEKYLHKCDDKTLAWIKKVKTTCKTFLITGSNADFAEFTASYAFGEDWKSMFDIIVCFAKKPGFFNGNRPFYNLKNHREDKIVTSEELKVGEIYNQGNWKETLQFLSRISGVAEPRCVYVGDNILQDIYTPSAYVNCDTVVIVDEQLAEGMQHFELSHSDEEIINSSFWGSYFGLHDSEGYVESLWNYIITRYSKICIPKLELISTIPLDEPLKCFEKDGKSLHGYYPAKPTTIPWDTMKHCD